MSRLAAWAGVALLVALVLWLLAPVLAPFLVAAVLAYVLNPAVLKLVRVTGGRLPRLLAVVLVEVLALLALLGVALLLVPILAREWPLLQQQIPLLFDKLDAALKPVLVQMGIPVALDLTALKTQLVAYLSANREDWWAPLMSSLKLGGSVALPQAGRQCGAGPGGFCRAGACGPVLFAQGLVAPDAVHGAAGAACLARCV